MAYVPIIKQKRIYDKMGDGVIVVNNENYVDGSGFPGAVSALSAPVEAIQTGILVVDGKRRILHMNEAAKGILQKGTNGLEKYFCHQLLAGTDTPCHQCPLLEKTLATAQPIPHIVETPDGSEIFIKEKMAEIGGYYLLTLFDVTREITALKTIDLARKELNAKIIISEQRQRKKEEENRRLTQTIDQLPEALVLIDETFDIQRKNKAGEALFPFKDTGKCFTLLGKTSPCNGCPAENKFQDIHQKKKTHHVCGRYITETFSSTSDGGHGLLLFSDTTRQIELIEKIREQQDTIKRKNEILSNLVKLQTRMQNAKDPREVLDFFLDVFLPICRSESGAIIVNDTRASSVWLSVACGLSSSQVKKLTGGYLSREVQSHHSQSIPGHFLPWPRTQQFYLIGGGGQRVGIILFEENEKTDEGVRQLFSESLGAFLHNKLLMRQLEEKANTDPLTGLYNRGYMNDTLRLEKEKYTNYGLDHAIIVADVNGLKQANDQYGHDIGDQLIVRVGNLLKSAIRDTDTVARTGGDEFLVLLSDTNFAGALKLIDRLNRATFHNVYLPVDESRTFQVSVSLGAAATDQTHPDELVKTADQRMYAAKEAHYKHQKRYRC